MQPNPSSSDLPSAHITLVAGPLGAGKTTWIQQQIQALASPALYLTLGTGEAAIDAAYLTAALPSLTVLPVGADFLAADFLADISTPCPIYLELGFHIDLASLSLPEPISTGRRVAIVPPGDQQTEWHRWADALVTGVDTSPPCQQPQLWRSTLTGQVVDFDSLQTFWYELTHGAYGNIQRAKGIFDIADGRAFYCDFAPGCDQGNVVELDIPRWLEGRPTRFSGIELVGEALSQDLIAQTLKDCCLDDQAIAHYQQQIKTLMEQPGAPVL